MSQKIGGISFHKNKYGMVCQSNPQKFSYDKPYLQQQSTTLEMSYLRLGFLLAHVPFEMIRDSNALELGPGTGVFFEVLKKYVHRLDGYDVVPNKYSSVSLEQVRSQEWDLLCAFDVIEHFSDIDDLWKINFKVGYFSSPCPPPKGIFHEWRHFKPNEHLTYIGAEEFYRCAYENNYEVLACAYPEDCIRTRWDKKEVNINSYIIRKK